MNQRTRQVTSSILTGYGAKLHKLDKAAIPYDLVEQISGTTIVLVSEDNFTQANELCRTVPSRSRKTNKGWRV